jgi:hypothetical protein
MIKIITATYILLLTNAPCDVFTFFNQKEISGFTEDQCQAYEMNDDSLSVGSWNTNVPNPQSDEPNRFVLINLSVLSEDSLENSEIIKNELRNQSYWVHKFDESKMEEIEEWVDSEYQSIYKPIENELRSRYIRR